MGRGKFKRGRGGGGGGGGPSQRQTTRYTRFAELPKENERLQMYYDGLLGFSEEAQREGFWAALQKELPNSFRFCGSKGHALAVKKQLQTRYIPEITKITHFDGQQADPPQPVPWYPDGLAWWMTTPKNVVRKYPPFAAFQRFLVSETCIGNVSRQEVVSMIPPLLMDVRPGMAVLDLCAAPGSKAGQLLEMIHQGEEGRIRTAMASLAQENGLEMAQAAAQEVDVADLDADAGDDGRATGILIANDADYKRSHLLIHQLKRLSSPNMIVTNHDATMYPSLRLPSDNPKEGRYLKFDRILADVPCSGDGTLRKNINLWRDWHPGNALGLHLTQVRILVRALQMLKPGGRVVYSTCSMNPVENESVVLSAIERCGGPEKIEILDCSEQLPGLAREPGLKKWNVMDKSGRIWNSWAEVEEYTKSTADGVAPGRLVEGMFPRSESSEYPDLPIERCLRIYAHLQDTGAFFITALQKKAEFKARPEPSAKPVAVTDPRSKASNKVTNENGTSHLKNEESLTQDGAGGAEVGAEEGSLKRRYEASDDDDGQGSPKKLKLEEDGAVVNSADAKIQYGDGPKPKPKGPYEEPFKYIPADHEVLINIRNFYQVSPRFPADRFMVRNALGEPAKAVYYTSALVRDILVSNEGKSVKFIHGGVKMFVKQDAPSAEVCRWRIQSEGMPILQGYVGPERVVRLHKKETLRKLLVEMFPMLAHGGWENLGEIGPRARDIGMGCCVLRIEPEAGDEDLEPMALPLWKSFHSLNLMLPKEDRSAMLLRIFDDTTPLINISLRKTNGAKQEPKGEEAVVKAEEKPVMDAEENPPALGGEADAVLKEDVEDGAGMTMYDIEDAASE